MPAVTFSSDTFKLRYPEFAAITDGVLQIYFDEACLYLANADKPISNEARRLVLLNMLTAHVASLGGVLGADGKPSPVGRISNATQGSVSVGFEYGTPGTADWFKQTQYGVAFWQATANLRNFRYRSCQVRY